MRYPTREAAHHAMIDQAQEEFERTGYLPRLTVVENPATGECRIVRGNAPIEDGMAQVTTEISNNRSNNNQNNS